MTTLGSLVVARRVATIAEVDEALARQVVEGGDLATCLLEVSTASERSLVALLAESMGIDAAPAGELPRAPDALLRRVSQAAADKHALYPIAERDGELTVAVAEPLARDVDDDLGIRVRACAAPLVRIRQALARDYGSPLEKRFSRLLGRLEHGRASPSSQAPPTPAGGLARPPAGVGADAAAATNVTLPTLPGRRRTLPGLPRPGETTEARVVGAAPLAVPIADPDGHLAARGPTTRTLYPLFAPSGPADNDAHAEVTATAAATATATDTATTTATTPPTNTSTPSSAPATPLTGQVPSQGGAAGPVIEGGGSGGPSRALLSDAARATAFQLDQLRKRRASPPAKVLAGWARRALGNTVAGDRAPEARRGPLTAADAEHRLLAASRAEDVLAIFFAFARQYFEYSALFVVHGDLAEGHDAAGPGARRDQLRGVGVALDLPSILASARTRGAPVIGKLARAGLDFELRADLGRATTAEVIVIPVVVRGRCVALLYGDDGDAPVELGDIGPVIGFVHLAASALERMLMRRKRAALGQRSSAPPPPSPHPARVIEIGIYAPPPTEATADSAPGSDSAALLVAANEHALRVEVPRPAAGQQDAIRAAAPPEPEVVVQEGAEDVALQDLVDGVNEPAAASGQLPPRARATSRDLPSTSMSAEAQLPPPSRRPYRDLPPVLIRPELIDQVIGGGERGERALGEILALGEAAIPSVFARFPGPLTVDRRQPIGDLPRPADCGPVLRIVAAMRRLALPFLAVRSGDTDAEVRFWATYLLGELNYTDAGQALFPRLFDESAPVRKIAARAARNLLAAGEGGAPLRKSLERLVIYGDEPEARRVLAMATLAELRLYRSVPALIAALSDPSFAVSDGAARALAILTRLEFGHDAKKWRDWWDSKGQKRLV